MKPAGPERNIRIQELRGYKIVPAPSHWKCDSKIGLQNINKESDIICPDCQLPDYSGYRNDSWELWDEMKKVENFENITIGLDHRIIDDGHISQNQEYFCELYLIGDVGSIIWWGKDEADAISGAYVKYMEAKND